jgi:hypothetical protein
MRPIFLGLLVTSTSACNPGGAAADAQLEALGFQSDAALGEDGATYTVSGDLEVSGADRDFTLAVSDATTTLLDAELHSSGGLELGALDGRAGAVSIVPNWGGGAVLVAIEDESGLAYLGNRGASDGQVDAWFGADFATYGAELGGSRDENFDWSYRTVRFATDDGAVEIAPGDVDTVTVGGDLWQIAVIASYDRTLRPDGSQSECGPPDDLISYEMLRVSTTIAPTSQLRLADRAMAEGPGCGG